MKGPAFQRSTRDNRFKGMVAAAGEISKALRRTLTKAERTELANRLVRMADLSQTILSQRGETIDLYSPKIQKAYHFIQRAAHFSKASWIQEPAYEAALFTATFPELPESQHDLTALFNKVNLEYFENKLAPKSLHWSPRVSLNRLGYYAVEEDRIVISKSLRSKQVPAYVIEFILFHECLHKVMGCVEKRGRRHYHTPEFRTLEKTHQYFHEAEAFLKEGLYRFLPR